MSENWKFNFNQLTKPPKISQWFVSLEGEGDAIGQPSMYIRLAGCYSSHCSFCDTEYSQHLNGDGFWEIGDRKLSLDISEALETSTPRRLTITGGEPLHFMASFPDIYRWVNNISPVGISFLGIESNGNLLKDEENCLSLLQSFNEIIREHNVTPTLTISPKLDADTCYGTALTQDEVDRMYFTTFKNISDYLQPYPIFYKFIFDFTDKLVNFKHQKIFIDYLIDELETDRKHIMLMPFTPDDPLEKDKEFWEKSKDATARKALELGVTYSPRIHIDRRLD